MFFFLLCCSFFFLSHSETVPRFTISDDSFLKDGKPFRIVSGDVHYWRTLPDVWRRNFALLTTLGMNTVTTYVNWALHEPSPGVFDFKGDNGEIDLVQYITTAADVGLLVIVRVGPYISAEVDFGGLPYWVIGNLTNTTEIRPRTPDTRFLNLVERYFDHLIPLLVPLQYSRGGPIINIQIDDTISPHIAVHQTQLYLSLLRDTLRKRGIDTLLNTIAPPTPELLQTALIPDTWPALELGYSPSASVAFERLRKIFRGPIMVMKFFPASYDVEGISHNTLEPMVFSRAVDDILGLNASVNIYPVLGGTNFGFSNGAHLSSPSLYKSVTTSYNYDAPINEAGDVTEKYYLIRKIFGKYGKLPPLPVPVPSEKGIYGHVLMGGFLPILFTLDIFDSIQKNMSCDFVDLGYGYGYAMYTVMLSNFTQDAVLTVDGMQDRALVYLDNTYQGLFGWSVPGSPTTTLLTFSGSTTPTLQILVENKGRCSSDLSDLHCAHKGLYGTPRVGTTPLRGPWTIYKLPMDDLATDEWAWWPYQGPLGTVPAFFHGTLSVDTDTPLDTYLETNGWGHGFVLVNGYNVGRFSELGPQFSLYVPASVLVPGVNSVVVFESDPPAMTLRTWSSGEVGEVELRYLTSVGQPLWS